MSEQNCTRWSEMLKEAVSKPGVVSAAYRAFHNYSLGNQLQAMFQCSERGIEPGPIATFPAWIEKGRAVRKGQKAISLWMPITGKRTVETKNDAGEVSETEVGYTRFILKNRWFVLSQTEGEEFMPEPIGEWDATRALAALNIERIPFTMTDGNCQGYAKDRQIAVSPIAHHPERTTLHEIAHIVLGHTAELMADSGEMTPRDIRELEAEATSMLCCDALGLPGVEESRGYIQGWFKGSEVPEKSAARIFNAADAILKAGKAVRS